MKTPNPLLPQGSLLEQQQKSKGKSNLVIAVFTILAVHLVLFGGLLMQGCKKKTDVASNDEPTNIFPGLDLETDNQPLASTNEEFLDTPGFGNKGTSSVQKGGSQSTTGIPPVSFQGATQGIGGFSSRSTNASSGRDLTNTIGTTTGAGQLSTNRQQAGAQNGSSQSSGPTSGSEGSPALPVKEYEVQKDDTMWAIAARNGISLSALREANPNVDPKTMQPGTILTIPAPARKTESEEEGKYYEVKKNDTLTDIARKYNTTVPKLKELNDLSTDLIVVGQKLKVPEGNTN